MIRWYALAGWGGLVVGLNGCAVYAPMQSAAPDIRGKGELEVTGSWSFSDRFDVGATYSPVPHLLVRAAASTKGSSPRQPATDSSRYAQVNQYEVALGTYWPLGARWLVGGLAGFGQAHAVARYDDDGFTFLSFAPPNQHQFNARYGKYSSEAYVTWQPSEQISLGLAYRVVQLRLTEVTDFGVPVQAAPILRSEPMFFFRLRPEARQGLFQLQVAVGSSSTWGYNERTASDRNDPARQFRLGRGYASVGVALYPHLLWRKK